MRNIRGVQPVRKMLLMAGAALVWRLVSELAQSSAREGNSGKRSGVDNGLSAWEEVRPEAPGSSGRAGVAEVGGRRGAVILVGMWIIALVAGVAATSWAVTHPLGAPSFLVAGGGLATVAACWWFVGRYDRG